MIFMNLISACSFIGCFIFVYYEENFHTRLKVIVRLPVFNDNGLSAAGALVGSAGASAGASGATVDSTGAVVASAGALGWAPQALMTSDNKATTRIRTRVLRPLSICCFMRLLLPSNGRTSQKI
jgi:hypothetical protein